MPRSKNFWAGLLFIAFGLANVWFSQENPLGTANNMGPAYFPTIMGILLCGLGLVILVGSLRTEGGAVVSTMQARPFIVLVAVIIFAFLVRPLGLVISTLMLVGVSAAASREAKIAEIVALSLGMAVFAVIVFAWGAGLRLPIWPTW